MTNFISIDSGDFSSGRYDGGRAIIRNPRYEVWNFNGKGTPTVGAWFDFEDEEGQMHPSFYPAGNPEYIKVVDENGNPVDDGGAGTHLAPVNEDRGFKLSPKQRFSIFLNSLQKTAGFKHDGLKTGDIRALANLEVYLEPMALPKKDGDDQQRTILIPTKVLSPAKGTAAAAKPTKSAKPAANVDVEEVATNALTTILSDPKKYIPRYAGDGTVTVKQASLAVFNLLGKNGGSDASSKVADPEFLALELGWTYDPDSNVLAEA